MKRSHDPLRLDLASFAAEDGRLAGQWPGDALSRLAESQAPPQDTPLADLAWQADAERRPVTGGEPELWLHLAAQGPVWLTCQRCLQPMQQALAIDRRLRFVRGEAEAEALDAELEDDVLALPRWLDLRELIEDELLLALPLVPRHEPDCPAPLAFDEGPNAAEEQIEERPHPFAALQALKKGRSGPAG
ncbi:DUF177 domain-containing protein [Aquincola sp. S2]|uniref:Large ribosomal RNA subunit accumulation protein YceD n=1 Tax=Pseudaquabacterium terrae TaxID=2732868 RepID=A0ABX2EDY2_9BURK|nr:DUF177 domain-containing protein [Aquabacterium terrae]NRF66830.1 DUF177 domain-containing protein [Aquabacterium terrae]